MATMPAESHSSTGPIIGSIIIVLILILGGLYYYGQQMMSTSTENPTIVPTQNVNEANTDQAVAKLKVQGSTDDLNSINADIQSTDTSPIDGDTANVKATLSQ
jgi:uncharacterized protein HemX